MTEINAVFTDGCMQKQTADDWLAEGKGKTCKFICFSRPVENHEKEYRVSFFRSVHNLLSTEIADRGVFENEWTVEGAGIVFPNVMKRCRKNFAKWGYSLSMYDREEYPVCPFNRVGAETILKAIEKFCLSGLVTVKFVNSHGNNFEEVDRENFDKINLNFV